MNLSAFNHVGTTKLKVLRAVMFTFSVTRQNALSVSCRHNKHAASALPDFIIINIIIISGGGGTSSTSIIIVGSDKISISISVNVFTLFNCPVFIVLCSSHCHVILSFVLQLKKNY